MTENLYLHYTSLDPSSKSHWTSYSRMVDGDLGNHAVSNTNGNMETLIGNNYDSQIGDILTVGIRAYLRYFFIPGRVTFRPYFDGSNLGIISSPYIATSETGAWTTVYDITQDSSGPGEGCWEWTDISNLDVVISSVISGDNVECSMVQIEVSYNPIEEDCNSPGEISISSTNYGNELYMSQTNYGNEVRLRSKCC
jgi:hypothetical protein